MRRFFSYICALPVWDDKPTKHLGCQYSVDKSSTKKARVDTTITSAMPEYFFDMVRRFEDHTATKVKEVDTPFLDQGADKRHKDELQRPGELQWIAPSV